MTHRRRLLALLPLLGLLLPFGATADAFLPPPAGSDDPFAPADSVVVQKSERRLLLIRDGRVFRSYRVSLGLSPTGHKEREGDFRTPEGAYSLTRRNSRSDFFLSIQVSYPNDQDARRARAKGDRPGGNIMIHGLPNVLRYARERYLANDWTDGCIALSNEDMLEVWLFTQANTPIRIDP
jgi:murein L,D-transpeptidase YafK